MCPYWPTCWQGESFRVPAPVKGLSAFQHKCGDQDLANFTVPGYTCLMHQIVLLFFLGEMP